MPVLPPPGYGDIGLTSDAYPLALPPLPSASSITITKTNVVGVTRSPFTQSRQVFRWPGELLKAHVELPPMKQELARAWVAWLHMLDGPAGTFKLFDTSMTSPRGVASGTPVVGSSGNRAGSDSLYVTGWTPSIANILRSGDWLSFLNADGLPRLHLVLLDADSDSGGEVTFKIRPRLRENAPHGVAIVTTYAAGTFALATNDVAYTVDEAMIYGIKFDAMEAF